MRDINTVSLMFCGIIIPFCSFSGYASKVAWRWEYKLPLAGIEANSRAGRTSQSFLNGNGARCC